MIFITDELGKFEKNIIELAENVGFNLDSRKRDEDTTSRIAANP